MKIRIPEYNSTFRVFSLALDESTKNDLLSENVEFIYIQPDFVEIYPDKSMLTQDLSVIAYFNGCNNYDVVGIYEDGTVFRYYDDSSNENAFFVTEKCNSNCIMCPSPDSSRKRGTSMEMVDLINIASHIPSDVSHITITGGEPFMVGRDIFELLDYCRVKFKNTEFLILTNARIFAINEYCRLIKESLPERSIIGVPIHGSCATIHDALTRSKDSFAQTMLGLRKLRAMGISLEIRIVVCKPNLEDIESIAKLILNQIGEVHHVSIMAMEMTGNARVNMNALWVPYKESFKYIKPAVELLVRSGIDVRLYNFPLCTVESEYRTLCAKSISSWKIRFAPTCAECSLKDACGGVFAGSYKLESDELEAVI